MGKNLSEMSLEELWQLFPIRLTPHRTDWEKWYQTESALLLSLLPQGEAVRLSHIGSTSIPSIWAKPIVDILLETASHSDWEALRRRLASAGYLLMSESPGRFSMNKGYTPQGFAQKVFHLHIRRAGDNDELYFRDYLREFPAAAKEYESLKLSLWKKYEHNRDGYTSSKTEFVRLYTAKGKRRYGGRY